MVFCGLPKLYWSCSEQRCLRGCCLCLFFLPRVAVPFAILWGTLSHIAYASAIERALLRIPTLIIGTLAGAFALISYFCVWRAGPGSPLEFPEFVVSDDTSDINECAPLVLNQAVEAKHDGGIRFCNKCMCFKPDRAHHCRHCGRCVLRMDHHCPWFSTCVGLRNHKYFLQFLWYVWALCTLAMLVALPRVYYFFKDEQYLDGFIGVNLALYFVLGSAFSLVLAAFASYTTWLVVKNRTTLESMEPQVYRTSLPASQWRYRQPPTRETLGNIYDVGNAENVAQVMGTTWAQWLLPVRPTLRLAGKRFPINEVLATKAEERAQTEIALHRRKQQWLEAQNQPQTAPQNQPHG